MAAPDGGSTTDATTTGTSAFFDGSTSSESTGHDDESSSGSSGPTPIDTASSDSDGSTSAGVLECPTGHFADDGSCARWVFVTQGRHDGTFGGHVLPDQLCQLEADGSAIAGPTFRAFLRTEGEPLEMPWEIVAYDAVPGASFVLPGAPEGNLVASSPEQLRTDLDPLADLDAPIDRDANGAHVDGSGTACNQNAVWTGLSRVVGTEMSIEGNTCGAWSGVGNGHTGSMSSTDEIWAGRTGACTCEDEAHFFCFEIPP